MFFLLLYTMKDLFFRYTLDCICEIAFGVKLNCLRDEKKPDFAIAFDAAQEITTFRWFAPKFVSISFISLSKKRKECNIDGFQHV